MSKEWKTILIIIGIIVAAIMWNGYQDLKTQQAALKAQNAQLKADQQELQQEQDAQEAQQQEDAARQQMQTEGLTQYQQRAPGEDPATIQLNEQNRNAYYSDPQNEDKARAYYGY